MFSIKKAIGLSIVLSSLVGCVSLPENPYYFGNGIDNQISSSAVTANVDTNIKKDFTKSNTTAAAGGGLLFALIDAGVNSSRAKDGQNILQSLNDSVDDAEIANIIYSPLNDSLSGLSWLKVNNSDITHFNSIEKKDEDTAEEGEKEQPAYESDLLVEINYRIEFSKTVDSFQLFAHVRAYPNTAKLQSFSQKYNPEEPRDVFNTVFLDSLAVSSPVVAGANEEETINKLAQENGAEFKQLLASAAVEISEKIKLSLKQRTLR